MYLLVLFIIGVKAVPMNIYGNQYSYRLPPQQSYKNLNAEMNSEKKSYYNEYDPMKNIRHAGR